MVATANIAAAPTAAALGAQLLTGHRTQRTGGRLGNGKSRRHRSNWRWSSWQRSAPPPGGGGRVVTGEVSRGSGPGASVRLLSRWGPSTATTTPRTAMPASAPVSADRQSRAVTVASTVVACFDGAGQENGDEQGCAAHGAPHPELKTESFALKTECRLCTKVSPAGDTSFDCPARVLRGWAGWRM